MSERVLVAMSGGVDSSVAALLLKRQGVDAVGVFLRNGVSAAAHGRVGKQGCCSVEDADDARRVAARLGIPFYALDYGDRFDRLIERFVEDYERGYTPSPCVLCNTWLKFGSLAGLAREVGAIAIATGHYARTEALSSGRVALRRARDADKDQSYFLASLEQAQLRQARFPLGAMTKDEVRQVAREAGLVTADKPESMEICFVPGGDYRALLEARRPGSLRPGPIVDAAGAVVGEHAGHQGFTIGQRRGVGVALGEPVYVTAIEPEANRVRVGPRSLLLSAGLLGERMTWVSVEPPPVGHALRALVQVRHRSPPAAAWVEVVDAASPSSLDAPPAPADTARGSCIRVRFDRPVAAIAPGQALALFCEDDPDLVLAGGWIAGPPTPT